MVERWSGWAHRSFGGSWTRTDRFFGKRSLRWAGWWILNRHFRWAPLHQHVLKMYACRIVRSDENPWPSFIPIFSILNPAEKLLNNELSEIAAQFQLLPSHRTATRTTLRRFMFKILYVLFLFKLNDLQVREPSHSTPLRRYRLGFTLKCFHLNICMAAVNRRDTKHEKQDTHIF